MNLREARLRAAKHYVNVLQGINDLFLNGHENIKDAISYFDLEQYQVAHVHAWVAQEINADKEILQLRLDYPLSAPDLFTLRQHPNERIKWLDLAVQSADLLEKEDDNETILNSLGNSYYYLGNPQKAIECYIEALAMSHVMGSNPREGTILGNLGLAYVMTGDFIKALHYHERALEIGRKFNDRRGEGIGLGYLGAVYARLGNLEKATECYKESLAIARETGNTRSEGSALGNLGLVYNQLNERELAIKFVTIQV